MGYDIEGIVMVPSVSEEFTRRFPNLRLVQLNDHLVLFPIDAKGLLEYRLNSEERLLNTYYLGSPLIDLLVDLSALGTVGYFSAEYFAGEGGKSVVVFRDRQQVYVEDGAEGKQTYNAFNEALSFFVDSVPTHSDLFDAVGFGRHRRLSEWLAEARGENPPLRETARSIPAPKPYNPLLQSVLPASVCGLILLLLILLGRN